jgi:hypothetical protein
MKILKAHCHVVILSHSGTLYVYTIISMHRAHNQECHLKVGPWLKIGLACKKFQAYKRSSLFYPAISNVLQY